MRLVVLLEHHFYIDENKNIWCDRVVNYNYFKRYLHVFEDVLVIARGKQVNKVKEGAMIASGKGVEFAIIPDFYGVKEFIFKIKKIREITKKCIDNCDCILLRTPSILSICLYDIFKKSSKPIGLEMCMAANKMFLSSNCFLRGMNYYIDKYVKYMCMDVDGVAYVTQSVLQSKYPCKKINGQEGFTATYSSIDLNDDFFYNRTKYENNKCRKMIHVGYMDDNRKGQDIAVKTLHELRKKGMDIELTLIGDGNSRIMIEELVSNMNLEKYVKFEGAVNEKKVIRNKLIDADVFILPTQSEGLPRSIIEAMAVGLPCVASNVDGIPELLEKKYLVDDFNPKKYAEKIRDILESEDDYLRISKNNYKKALTFRKYIMDSNRKEFYTDLKCLANNKNINSMHI